MGKPVAVHRSWTTTWRWTASKRGPWEKGLGRVRIESIWMFHERELHGWRSRPYCRLSLRERMPFRGAKGDFNSRLSGSWPLCGPFTGSPPWPLAIPRLRPVNTDRRAAERRRRHSHGGPWERESLADSKFLAKREVHPGRFLRAVFARVAYSREGEATNSCEKDGLDDGYASSGFRYAPVRLRGPRRPDSTAPKGLNMIAWGIAYRY